MSRLVKAIPLIILYKKRDCNAPSCERSATPPITRKAFTASPRRLLARALAMADSPPPRSAASRSSEYLGFGSPHDANASPRASSPFQHDARRRRRDSEITAASAQSADRADAQARQMLSSGASMTPLRTPDSQASQVGPLQRPDDVEELVSVSMLQAAIEQLNPEDRARAQQLLKEVHSVMSIQDWYKSNESIIQNKAIPFVLSNTQVGLLNVTYAPMVLDAERRFASGSSLFKLKPKAARISAIYGLYEDFDLCASFPVVFEELCKRAVLDHRELTDFLDDREAKLLELGSAVLGAHASSLAKRAVAKAITSGLCFGMGVTPSTPAAPEKNSLRKVYDEYGVPSASAPILSRWTIALSREMRDNTKALAEPGGPHGAELQEIRAKKGRAAVAEPATAVYHLCSSLEYACLNAALEYALEHKLSPVCDCLDGYLFLSASFSPDKTMDEYAEEMTAHIRSATGIARARMVHKVSPPMRLLLTTSYLRPCPSSLLPGISAHAPPPYYLVSPPMRLLLTTSYLCPPASFSPTPMPLLLTTPRRRWTRPSWQR